MMSENLDKFWCAACEANPAELEEQEVRGSPRVGHGSRVLGACKVLDLTPAKLDEDGLVNDEVERIVEAELARRAQKGVAAGTPPRRERGEAREAIVSLDCGDNSCRYRDRSKPGGMRTNGGCLCDECPWCGVHLRPGRGHRDWCNGPERLRHLLSLTEEKAP